MQILIFLTLLLSLRLQASTETKEFSGKNIVRVELENQIGKVKIIGKDTDKVTVTAEKVKFSDKCNLSYKQSHKVIEIESDKKSFFSDADCEVNFTVGVPKRIDLDLKNSRGQIDVFGTSGKLEVKVASGNVHVQSEVEDLEAKAGSGNIEVNGLLGNADVKIGAGDIKLTYAKDPGKGEVDIKSGAGDATLFFPPKMKVHSKILLGSGDAYNEIGDFKDAKFLISFKAGSGTLNIKEAPATDRKME